MARHHFTAFVLSLIVVAVAAFVLADLYGSVTIQFPANGTYLNGTEAVNLTFNGTVNLTIEYNTTSAGFLPLNTASWQNDSYSFSWVTTNGSFPDGTYALRFNVTNASLETDNQTIIVANITVDNNAPVFSPFTSPAAGARYKDGQGILVNVTVNDSVAGMAASQSCLVRIDNGTSSFSGSVFLSTTNGSTGTCNGTITLNAGSGLADGTHWISVNATDLAGNQNVSMINVVVDNTPPAVTNFRTNHTYVRSNAFLHFNVTVTDGGSILWVNISNSTGGNTTNMTAAGGNLFQFNTTLSALGCYGDGGCVLNITALDDLSNRNNTVQLTVTIDDTNPAVTSPAVNTSIAKSTASVNLTVTVTDGNTTSVVAYNGSAVTMSLLGGSVYNATTTYAALGCSGDGACLVRFNTTDGAGNTNNTASFTVTVDDTNPNLTLNAPANNTNQSASVTFNFTVTDVTSTPNSTLYINGSANQSFIGNGTHNVTLTFSAGVYSWYVAAVDNASNTNTSVTRIFTVDTAGPLIQNVSNGSITSSSVVIQWNISEDANGSVNYGGSVALGTVVGNDSLRRNHSVSISSLTASSTYYYNITSCDSSGNCNTTGPYSFTTSAAAATSDSGGGGRSGGGGGAAGSPTLTSTPTQKILSPGGSYSFNVPGDGITHRVVVKEIRGNGVLFVLYSSPVEMFLQPGESKEVDITDDGIVDVKVTLVSFTSGTAKFDIALVTREQVSGPEPAAPESTEVTAPVAGPAEPQAPPAEAAAEPTPAEELPPQEVESGTNWLLWSLLVIVVAVAALLLLRKRGKNEEFYPEHETRSEPEPKPHRKR